MAPKKAAAPPPVEEPSPSGLDWPFEPRNVNFKLCVRAAFNPSIGQASVTVPWFDAAGELTQQVSSGPLSSLVAPPEGGSGGYPVPQLGRTSPSWTGGVWVEFEKDLGPLAVTEKLMRSLQKANLPVSIQLGENEAKGTGRVPLGPLLLANVEPPEPEVPLEPVVEKGKGGKAPDKGKKEDPKAKKAAKPVTPPPAQEEVPEQKKEEEPPPPQIPRRIRSCEVQSSWTEAIGVAGLHRLEVVISTDRPVLSPEMLKRFVPVCFRVETVRNLPNERPLQDLSEGVRVEVRPRLSTTTAPLEAELERWSSTTVPHDTCIRFSEPVVWLLGLSPLHCVREWMQNEELIVEVRDRELKTSAAASAPAPAAVEKPPAEEPPAGEEGAAAPQAQEVRALTHPHGIASFNLAPVLDAHNLQVSLRAEVMPQRGNKKRRNAELSREQLRTQGLLDEAEGSDRLNCVPDRREVAPQYARHATICTMTVSLAVPIPPAPILQKEQEADLSESWAANEMQDASGTSAAIHKAGDVAAPKKQHGGKATEALSSKSPYRAKVPKESGDVVTGPWRRKLEEAADDEAKLVAAAAEEGGEGADPALDMSTKLHGAGPSDGLDARYERFGRAVLVFNDKDTASIKSVLEALRQHNGGVLGIDAASYHLDTRELTEEEIADPFLDLVTGFMLLDGQYRLAVIEGLREKDGLEKVLEAVPGRGSAEGPRCKMLYHSGVGFSERLYTQFGPLLKQIKVRTTLEKLAAKPELYSTSVPCTDEVLETMQAVPALKQLCRLDRLHVTRQGILYPEARHLKQLEILYGDYITDGELEGGPPGPSTRSPKKPQKAKQGRRLTLDRATVLSPAAALMQEPGGATSSQDNAATLKLGADLSLGDGAGVVTQDLRHALTEANASASSSRKAATDQRNKAYESTLRMRAEGALDKNHIEANRSAILERSMENSKINDLLGKKQKRETPFLEGKEVYIYSGQKLNCTEIQKDWMRQEMLLHEEEKCWSYAPAYLSQNFELTAEGAESGVRDNRPERYNDTYANKAGDARPPWRAYHPRPPEEFRRPPRDIPAERREDIREPFVENEWHRMPLGEERQKPVGVAVRFEPDKLPHVRRIPEKPFDPARAQASNRPFGPQAGFQSVHYHGRAPGESRGEETLKHNLRERELEKSKIRGETWMRTFSQGATRSCVTDLDRHEVVLKPTDPIEARKGTTPMTKTLRHEPFQEFGRPDLEFQSRMRENHASPPYDVRTGGYVQRDPTVGRKEAFLSGKLSKAPWRHGAGQFAKSTGPNGEYPSNLDFDLTRQPPIAVPREEHVVKNASRAVTNDKDRAKGAYKRPRDFGAAHIVQPAAA
mmetsp:Transcript_21956/g.51366  ORF Transcript_21956/g.51366 Transcript_21956/m.51366 type:complete len:1344 (-) Transcript_21956:100-4131(-)